MTPRATRWAVCALVWVIATIALTVFPAGVAGAVGTAAASPTSATRAVPARTTPEPGTTTNDPDTEHEPSTTTDNAEPVPSTTLENQPTTSAATTTTPPRGESETTTTTTTARATTVPAEHTPTTVVDETDRQPTTSVATITRSVNRPSASPRVRDSEIPTGSIALSLLILIGVGVVSFRVVRQRSTLGDGDGDEIPLSESAPTTATETTTTGRPSADRTTPDRPAIDPATANFLAALGEALMDAGTSVGHVETALRNVARVGGVDRAGLIVLPTALIVSVPDGENLVTELGSPGRAPLRFDQIEDVLRLLDEAEAGTVGPAEGKRRLTAIRAAPAPYPPALITLGNACSAAGLAAILHGSWVELALAAVLGAAVGALILATRNLGSSYQPFVILLAATAMSATVFGVTRVIGDALTVPLLIAPLIAFLPGGLLTIGILELSTGQIISGTARLASGGLQLVFLAIGLVAGAQLVGVPIPVLRTAPQGVVTPYLPWIGVGIYGLGVVWFQCARAAARPWMLAVMYVAYAGQVIGGLFFGSSLSAFFGALAMTPVVALITRRDTTPSPLVLLLPAFWLLVPGALGLTGVTALFGAGGVDSAGVLVTTVTSMIGVSLGILLGLLLTAPDPRRPFSGSASARRDGPVTNRPAPPVST